MSKIIHWQCLQMSMSAIGCRLMASLHVNDDAYDDERDFDDTN